MQHSAEDEALMSSGHPERFFQPGCVVLLIRGTGPQMHHCSAYEVSLYTPSTLSTPSTLPAMSILSTLFSLLPLLSLFSRISNSLTL